MHRSDEILVPKMAKEDRRDWPVYYVALWRKNYSPVQAQAQRVGSHHPHRRVQRREPGLKNLNMTIWDVGGQKTIRALWRHYYANTQVRKEKKNGASVVGRRKHELFNRLWIWRKAQFLGETSCSKMIVRRDMTWPHDGESDTKKRTSASHGQIAIKTFLWLQF